MRYGTYAASGLGLHYLPVERLEKLQREFDENALHLDSSFSIADLQQLKERREAILLEARRIAGELKIVGRQWFDSAE